MNVNPKPDFYFIALMALLMTITALGTDIMMPALGQISNDFQLGHSNAIQLVISMIFLGMALGFCFYGPLADAYGRKSMLYLGLGIFILGSVMSIFTDSFDVLLVSRVLQGFGAAACRIIPSVMIRDKFEGRKMARTYSLIMMLFIVEPAISPSIGQFILLFSGWRFLFVVLLVFASICFVLVWLGQEETLPVDQRIPLTLSNLMTGTKTTLTHPLTLGYTICSGLVAGAFLAYLTTAQQILQHQYHLGSHFPLVFGLLAICIGLGSYFNAKLVIKFGMHRMCLWGFWTQLVVATVEVVALVIYPSHTFYYYVSYLAVTLFTLGVLFGNLNTLAMEPMGDIAGIANSVISGVQTLLSVLVGIAIGSFYSGSALPLVLGFLVTSCLSLIYFAYLNNAKG